MTEVPAPMQITDQ
uniref:Uncharacterized protein n=1 Tax=Anguilla anguilla TaxID=7936 RepID=A0A0E9QD57_ANGAN